MDKDTLALICQTILAMAGLLGCLVVGIIFDGVYLLGAISACLFAMGMNMNHIIQMVTSWLSRNPTVTQLSDEEKEEITNLTDTLDNLHQAMNAISMRLTSLEERISKTDSLTP